MLVTVNRSHEEDSHMPSPDFVMNAGDEDRELADQLDREIYYFNASATGVDDGRPLYIRVSDESGALIAGLSGWTWAGCGYVDVLWVATGHRGQGLGTRLMEAAEAEAMTRGCSVMALSSHSFQAPDFYRRRGYVQTGETPDYPLGHSQVHLRKALSAPAPPAQPVPSHPQ
jgi:GNAT superfamily N-acetyltransferase